MIDRKEHTVGVYRRIAAIIFDRLSPTFGQRTIAAITKNVLARQSKRHPALASLQVQDSGVVWDNFLAHIPEFSEEEIASSLEDFLDEFFDALSNLIGRLIVGRLFKEAEDLAQKGDEA